MTSLSASIMSRCWDVLCHSVVMTFCNVISVLVVSPDIDECSASSPVCDVNGNCQNNGGSYLCSCKTGYTGDGKSCSGKKFYCFNILY